MYERIHSHTLCTCTLDLHNLFALITRQQIIADREGIRNG